MKKSRCSEEQIVGILRQVRAGSTVAAVCAAHNIGVQTYYGWKRKYGGMQVDEVRQLRALVEENARLKRLVAELSVQNQILKEVNAKNGKPVEPAPGSQERGGRRGGQHRAELPCGGALPFRFLSFEAAQPGKPTYPPGGAGVE
jgi:putative transposase